MSSTMNVGVAVKTIAGRRGMKAILLSAVVMIAAATGASAQDAIDRAGSAVAGDRLFVGANYQPVDRTPEEIHQDIALMRRAGLNIVRMGDLAWDYFEPTEGHFDFDRFDAVMDEMHANGIRVILDIPGQPAPVWLHHRYPGVDLVNQDGVRLNPAERYMDDIADPDYRRLLHRMADTLTKRYAKHPAVIAVGYNNEIGNGFMSYSEADRERFVTWLRARYGDLDTLNRAWATQRWSRRIGSWDEVQLPYGDGPGPFERYLDLRRYWSEETIDVLSELDAVRQRNMPGMPALSNLWPGSGRRGFDYLSSYRRYTDHGAFGYYAGDAIGGAYETMQMRGALDTPVWFNEFQAGGGGYYGARGRSRMWAYFGLLNGGQGFLAWTFNSHRGGEEQALFGLIDHDNTPSWKLDEWGVIASEFKKLETMGFPRKLDPQVAFAYSFEAEVASDPHSPTNTVRQYFTTPYMDQQRNAFAPIYKDNIDAAVIDVAHEDLSPYKLVVVPGLYLMNEAAAANIRSYVQNGGTVIMTAFSAKVDETNQWFNTSLPGRLSDVFGLRTNEFNRASRPLTGTIAGQAFTSTIDFYEVLEPSTATVMGRIDNVDGKPPVATVNTFGKGRAIYLATPAQPSVMTPLYRSLYAELGIDRGPTTPDGVYARVVDGRTLYVNSTGEEKTISITGDKSSVLHGNKITGTLQLSPWGVDLIEGHQ
ncbi:MAG: beta-galactosidase [Brevundimonas sp.]|uniref:beta-galactosidase n=1 Tax=Brevundimonas sp. TaxID=1871086 RepID=UPI002722D41A|nr:beta-galactosidase [Brevundimonas sp.]MDO9609404.1 beta-galactosidase [Brevundimonas sp.]